MSTQNPLPTDSRWMNNERDIERHSSQYHSIEGDRRRQRDAYHSSADNNFGDFPPQMTQHATLDTTPQITNRRADVQFTEDSRLSEMRSNRVLVLGGGGVGSKNQRQSSAFANTPSATKMPQSHSLDYSMITTPGAVGILETPDETNNNAPSSTGRWAASTPFSNILRGVVSSTPGTEITTPAPTPYTAARELLNNHRHPAPIVDSDTTPTHPAESTALTFAKSAPLSGYLRKLGKNIPTFKRRFFVLKPSTHLYYFISPNDVEPRGCIDLDRVWKNDDGSGEISGSRGGCEVREIGSFPDGTFRFELLYDEECESEDVGNNIVDDNDSDAASRSSQHSRRRNFQRQSIVLEARTEEMGREWMAKLQSERLSTARDELNSLRKNLDEMKSNNLRWESSAYEESLRADEAERQRNTAISDARKWEEKFINLNEAIRLLVKSSKNRSTSEQEGASAPSDFLTETIEDLDVNGTNFDDLSKAFHNIHNNYNELSKREDAVNGRIAELEHRAKDAESRAVKAETELSKVIEEHQTTQTELKKTKREKKILVKEVRSLHASAKAKVDQQAVSDSLPNQKQHDLHSSNSQQPDTASLARQNRLNDEERRLVIELEEHVMSGLRLSDQFLTLNGIDPSEILDDLDSSVQASSIHDGKSILDKSPPRPDTQKDSEDVLIDLSPIPGTGVGKETYHRSLLDEKDDDSEDDPTEAETKSVTPNYLNNVGDRHRDANAVNSMNYTRDSTHRPVLHNHAFQYQDASPIVHQNLNARFIDTTREREATMTHQSTQSNEYRKAGSTDRALPSLDVASSASESSRSRVTDNGIATTKLECPLNDVEDTVHYHNRSIGDDGNVYHITFYGNKIGLQFQKVPNESKSGLLTEAMTADHGPNVGGPNQTAAELRRIASISQQTHAQQNEGILSNVCLPVTPADAVLVCGCVGFDASFGNTPPQIGGKSNEISSLSYLMDM
jgi:hypothetical protein